MSQLQKENDEIEAALDGVLEWRELRVHSHVSIRLDGHNPEDRDDWPLQHDWLAGRLNDLHAEFADRVRNLDG